MPSALTSPGVYIEEIPSGVRTIIGVSTSTTAFVGRAMRGPVDEAVVINGQGDFDRTFGGLWSESRLGFAVRDFFRNGGSQAVIVRAFSSYDPAETKAGGALIVEAIKTASDVKDALTAAAGFVAPDDATQSTGAGIDATRAAVVAAAAAGATLAGIKAAAAAAAESGMPFDRARLTVGGTINLVAWEPGSWGGGLRARIDTQTPKDIGSKLGTTDEKVFNLRVTDTTTGQMEVIQNVAFDTGSRLLADVLEGESRLVRLADPPGAAPALTDGAGMRLLDPWQRPKDGGATGYEQKVKDVQAELPTKASDPAALATFFTAWADPVSAAQLALDTILAGKAAAERAPGPDATSITKNGDAAITAARAALNAATTAASAAVSDGGELTANDVVPLDGEATFHGLYALAKADIFNLLVIPPYSNMANGLGGDVEPSVISAAAVFCEQHRAMLIVDAPSAWPDKSAVTKGLTAEPDLLATRSKNAALYFPRIRQPNPLGEMREETFTPSGIVAGVMARTDTERGVWKAPAGLDASLVGVARLTVNLTDGENGELNPRGVNCLRFLPPGRRVIWGARTLDGDDRLASEWKYVPIRRTALFIEESLYRGTQWVVFEPNDEPLWASIRLNVGAFMNGLFRQGAFQGKTPREAYFVRCDHDTNPQADIDKGVVNIVVGFAPLKPAEFVVIQLQQIAGQIEV